MISQQVQAAYRGGSRQRSRQERQQRQQRSGDSGSAHIPSNQPRQPLGLTAGRDDLGGWAQQPRKQHRCIRVASISETDMVANVARRHMRGPTQKGSHWKRCRAASRPPRNLRAAGTSGAQLGRQASSQPGAVCSAPGAQHTGPAHRKSRQSCSPVWVKDQRILPHRGRAVQRRGGHEHHVPCGAGRQNTYQLSSTVESRGVAMQQPPVRQPAMHTHVWPAACALASLPTPTHQHARRGPRAAYRHSATQRGKMGIAGYSRSVSLTTAAR